MKLAVVVVTMGLESTHKLFEGDVCRLEGLTRYMASSELGALMSCERVGWKWWLVI